MSFLFRVDCEFSWNPGHEIFSSELFVFNFCAWNMCPVVGSSSLLVFYYSLCFPLKEQNDVAILLGLFLYNRFFWIASKTRNKGMKGKMMIHASVSRQNKVIFQPPPSFHSIKKWMSVCCFFPAIVVVVCKKNDDFIPLTTDCNRGWLLSSKGNCTLI